MTQEDTPPTPTTAIPMARSSLSVDQLIVKYIALRDKKDEIVKAQKVELAKYNAAFEWLEGQFTLALNDMGVDNMSSAHGTIYKSTSKKFVVRSWEKTLEFILAHNLTEFLEARVNKTAVDAYITENKVVPPGIEVSQYTATYVRRG